MPIDIGDAVLTFTGDTTQLDAAFNRIASETGAKLGPAAAAIDTATKGTKDLGEGLDNAGKSGGEAGKNIKDGMDKAESSSHEARGEVALLGDLFGIHLPRHVRSFIAELPIIST